MQQFRSIPYQIKLSDEAPSVIIPQQVQILRCGSFNHPVYGKFEITPTILAEMKKNFESKVRGVDLAIDYSHESDKQAAGWIKQLELKDDNQELWASVDWTPKGKEIVEGKEFRYLSADFMFKYTDSETGLEHNSVLLGAALTNRPYIKEMAPIVQLSEIKIGKENKKMGDDTDQKIKDLLDQVQALQKKDMENEAMMGEMKKKLAEYEESEKKMLAAKKLAELESKFAVLLAEGKVCPAQKESFMGNDAVKFAELAQPIKLSSIGNSNEPPVEISKNAQEEVLKRARVALSEDKKLDLGLAISKVLNADSELNKKYQEETKLVK